MVISKKEWEEVFFDDFNTYRSLRSGKDLRSVVAFKHKINIFHNLRCTYTDFTVLTLDSSVIWKSVYIVNDRLRDREKFSNWRTLADRQKEAYV